MCFFVSVSPLPTIECYLSGMLPPSFQMSQDAMPINTYSAVHITGNSQSYMATKRLHFPSYSTMPITGTPLAKVQTACVKNRTSEVDELWPEIERTQIRRKKVFMKAQYIPEASMRACSTPCTKLQNSRDKMHQFSSI